MEPFRTTQQLPTLVDSLRDAMLLSTRGACYVPLVSDLDNVTNYIEGASAAHNVHAVLQGAFSETAIRSAHISEFSNTPILSFGATADELSDKVSRG